MNFGRILDGFWSGFGKILEDFLAGFGKILNGFSDLEESKSSSIATGPRRMEAHLRLRIK